MAITKPVQESASKKRFVHITSWPIYQWEGNLYTFDLWRKDLELHFLYLERISLVSPIRKSKPPQNCTKIDPQISSRIDLIGAPQVEKTHEAIFGFVSFFFMMIPLILKSEAIQVILVEHPLWYGILIPILKLTKGPKTIIFVESSSWRNPNSRGFRSWAWRIREKFATWAVSNATVSFHTQAEYLKSLRGKANSSAVIPAVWMDETDVISESELERVQKQRSQSTSLSIGYFGGLIKDKGLDILVKAVVTAIQSGMDLHLEIFGEGPIRKECELLAAPAASRINFCGMLPYGPIFRNRLSLCDVVVIPSRTNEHLRINVDALSQGVPVIASDVPGLSQFIDHGKNGLLFSKESVTELIEALVAISDPDFRKNLAKAARASVAGLSHRKMHLSKASLIRRCIPNLSNLLAPLPEEPRI